MLNCPASTCWLINCALAQYKSTLRGIEIKCLTEGPYCSSLSRCGVIHAHVCCHSVEVLKWQFTQSYWELIQNMIKYNLYILN